MALMLSSVYDAFRSAGADEAHARQAVEELATYRSDIGEMKGDVLAVKGDLLAVKNLVTINITLTLLVIAGLIGLAWKAI